MVNNDGWKQNVNLGKVNNQNFVSIPFNRLIHMIRYKAEEYGIKVIVREESYTSRQSALDFDPLPNYGDKNANQVLREALQKPLLPSRMEQKCSVRFFLTT